MKRHRLVLLDRPAWFQPVIEQEEMAKVGGEALVGWARLGESRELDPANASLGLTEEAPKTLGEMRVVREGNQRWLVVPMPAEQLWPQLREFWTERGFNLVIDAPAGVMETDWAENRAKLPQDAVRRNLGRLIDTLYDTGERDRYRTRVERNGDASEVYISHRGMTEEYSGDRKEYTVWTPRPADPNLEAEFLTRLMVKLGTKEAVARDVVAKPAAAGPARARAIAGQSSLQACTCCAWICLSINHAHLAS